MREAKLEDILHSEKPVYMIIPVTELTMVEELRAATGFLVDDDEGAPDPPKEKPPAKKRSADVDVGKICALYRAGWNVKKIAEEVRCSQTMVTRKLNGAGIYKGPDPTKTEEDESEN